MGIKDILYSLTPREEQDPTASELFIYHREIIPTSTGYSEYVVPENKLLLLHYIHVAFTQSAANLNQVYVHFAQNDVQRRFYAEVLSPGSVAFRPYTFVFNELPIAHPRAIRAEGVWASASGTRTVDLYVGGVLVPLGTYVRR